MTSGTLTPDFASLKIAFHPEDKKRVFEYWDEIFTTQRWTDGPFTRRFEEAWEEWNGLPSAAFANWSGGALAALEYFGLKGKKVLCPSNTFIGTPLSVVKAGGEVVFGDCNREDLCLSYRSVVSAATHHDLAAVWLVHIGGHLAFDTPLIADFCRREKILLLEDCAHAHGASWAGKKPGAWGDAGVYSFYASKSVPTGEGGMLVSKHPGLIEFAKKYRAYGAPEHEIQGLNHRMSEFTAALGLVQTRRMPEIVAWKNEVAREVLDSRYPKRVVLPEGMVSGYYKYIVFEPVQDSTSKVYAKPCHLLMKTGDKIPNSEWVPENHWCAPLYYNPAP